MSLFKAMGLLLPTLLLVSCADKPKTFDPQSIEGLWKMKTEEAYYLDFSDKGIFVQHQVFVQDEKNAYFHQAAGTFNVDKNATLKMRRSYDSCTMDEEFNLDIQVVVAGETEMILRHPNGVDQSFSKVGEEEKTLLMSAVKGFGIANEPNLVVKQACLTAPIYDGKAPVVSAVGSLAKKKVDPSLMEQGKLSEGSQAPEKVQEPVLSED